MASPLFAGDHRCSNGVDRNWLRPVHLTPYNPKYNPEYRPEHHAENVADYGADILPLAGTGLGFSAIDVLTKTQAGFTVARMSVQVLIASAKATGADALALVQHMLGQFTTPRDDFAGLAMSHLAMSHLAIKGEYSQHGPHVMGIINVTPDSFSDGGDHIQSDIAIRSGIAMADAGASILDIGGESTRPGADAVSEAEECRRILPVIDALAKAGYCVSADTRHTSVMQQALVQGASLINDVGGLRAHGSAELIASNDAPVIIMHMQGEPGTMQKQPQYEFVAADVYDWLEQRINMAISKGIKKQNIAVDIGFGFGKTPQHNMVLMAWLSMFHGLGVPLLLGASRKSSIAHFSNGEAAKDRLPGSLALATCGYAQGVQMLRVHDVPETMQALALAKAVRFGEADFVETNKDAISKPSNMGKT